MLQTLRIGLFFFIFSFLAVPACKTARRPTTLLGYEYDHHINKGGRKPKAGEHAYFHAITMVEDSIIENTHVYPFIPNMRIEVAPDKEVEAIIDGLKVMGIGDSITLYIPMDSLPFAPAQFQSFKEIKQVLTLLDIKDEDGFKKDMAVRQQFLYALADSLMHRDSSTRLQLAGIIQDYTDNKLTDKLQNTEDGVKYLILREGVGERPSTGDMVEVNYVGALTNQFVFDASFPKGQPYVYRLNTGQVIKGWDSVISQFNEGTEAIVFIPPALAYGKAGSAPNIPPDAELAFYINLYKIRRL